jgi:hypothetical protein
MLPVDSEHVPVINAKMAAFAYTTLVKVSHLILDFIASVLGYSTAQLGQSPHQSICTYTFGIMPPNST